MSRKLITRVLLLGGSGQIGSHFAKTLKNKYKIFTPHHKELDISDKSQVRKFVDKLRPDHIVYSVGFTSIDNAPLYPYEALELNVLGVQNTAEIASKKNIPFSYLSTEVVFNGYKKGGPYTEDDKPDPLSLNAKLKRLGELVTMDSNQKNSIIRLIICYSPFYERKLDIARMAIKYLSEGKIFTATNNQEINPIYVTHLIKAISLIIDHQASGIYHVGAKDYTTPYEFCRKLTKKMRLNYKLIKSSTFKQFSKTRPEPRPQHEWLDVSKFLKTFGEDSLPSVDQGIDEFIKDYLSYKK